jgi:hypothetical protein
MNGFPNTGGIDFISFSENTSMLSPGNAMMRSHRVEESSAYGRTRKVCDKTTLISRLQAHFVSPCYKPLHVSDCEAKEHKVSLSSVPPSPRDEGMTRRVAKSTLVALPGGEIK